MTGKDRRVAVAKRLRDPVARLSWLARFAQMDAGEIDKLSDEKLETLQDEVLYFVNLQLGSPALATASVRELGRARVYQLRADLSERINSLLSQPQTGWSDPGLPRRLTRVDGAVRITPDSNDLVALLLACAFELVSTEGSRILFCARPSCGRFFVQRKRGLYCSPRCSQYMRTTRYRNKS